MCVLGVGGPGGLTRGPNAPGSKVSYDGPGIWPRAVALFALYL